MGSINKQISRYEITAVFTHPDAIVDVVLVHGLNGDPQRTWSSLDGKGVFWPADLLPQSLGKIRANILVYGYNADVYTTSKSRKSASNNFISQHAQTLVTNLTLYRKSERTSRNPIIFVAHSLGGLLVKRALLYSNDVTDRNQEDARSIFISTYGIIFLGTPHAGSDMATWGLVLQRMADAIAPRKVFESESILLKTLKRDNETLESISNHFLDIYQRFKIHMAHENHKTDVKGTKMIVVDTASAGPQLPGVIYYGIEATHSGMCKYDSASAPGYRNVSTAIRDWAEEAPTVIRTRWEIESNNRSVRAQSEAAERTRGYRSPTEISLPARGATCGKTVETVEPNTSADTRIAQATEVASPTGITSTTYYYSPSGSVRETSTPRPLFVHPDRFRPNSFFKGRKDELHSLHKLLTDPRRRSEGTSAVLVQGIPGAGKTHLARQYVFNHKEDYPGGIYWIRSTTLQDMEDGFWRIAKTEAIRGMAAQEEKKDLSNPQKMVEIVRSWFNESENWLLVFDGIRFGDDAVLDFIPDRPNSSLIYTSTERAEPGAYRLDNPSILKLGLLPVQDAQELLLEEMGKKQPYTIDDLRRAQDLVQLMGRLPLMIHAAALQMNATREPLAKYLKSFRDTPKVGVLPAYKTIRDQLQKRGDITALNPIYILSFFSQSMPVEMLVLGLKALDKRTPVKTATARHKRSLTQTFVTLINFALVERNETDDPSSSSQSSRQSVDLTPEPLDTLRVHSIVQAFFVELLAEEEQLEFWLERAVRVFCHSFDEADARINQDSDTGLPDDYRQYIRHGKKLMEHLDRYKHSNISEKARGQTNLQQESTADLISARNDLAERLSRLPGEIDELQKTISTDIVDGNETVRHASVFEHANSVSSRSTDTSGGEDLLNPTCPFENAEPESSLTFIDPNHFHMPYLSFPEDREPRNEDERSEGRTITPYPPDVIEGSYPDASEREWTIISRHRSARKQEQRRYDDRRGALRETAATANDPRVSISRESARGLITPPQSSRGGRSSRHTGLTATSEASASLMHIKKASPPPPRGGGYIHDKSRSSSTGTAAKPLSVLGKSSYANVVSGTAVEDETKSSPTFSTPPSRAGSIDRAATYDDVLSVNSLRTIDSVSLSIAQRMKENTPPHTIDSRDRPPAGRPPAPPQKQELHLPRHPYITNLLRRVTESVSGTRRQKEHEKERTTLDRSSKSLDTVPPASRSVERFPEMPRRGTRTASSSPGSQHPAFYPPELSIVTDQTSILRHDALVQQDVAPSRPPYPWNDREPYSEVLARSNTVLGRDGLNVSTPATTLQSRSTDAPPPIGYSSQPMSRNPSSNSQLAAVTDSTGTSVSSNSGSIRSALLRARAPSMIETEPSPRLAPMDMDQTPSVVWGRGQSGRPVDEAFWGGNNVPGILPMGQVPNFEAARESPLTSPRSSSGGENMARSGSGGIRLKSGRIIEFGDLSFDVAEADQR